MSAGVLRVGCGGFTLIISFPVLKHKAKSTGQSEDGQIFGSFEDRSARIWYEIVIWESGKLNEIRKYSMGSTNGILDHKFI